MQIQIPTGTATKESSGLFSLPDQQINTQTGSVEHRFVRVNLRSGQLTRLDRLCGLTPEGITRVYDGFSGWADQQFPETPDHIHLTVVFDTRGYPITTERTSPDNCIARRFLRLSVNRLPQATVDRLPDTQRAYRFCLEVKTDGIEHDSILVAGATARITDNKRLQLGTRTVGEMQLNARYPDLSYDWPTILLAMTEKDSNGPGKKDSPLGLSSTPLRLYETAAMIIPETLR